MMEKLGCRMDVAANREEAVAMWSDLLYDIVFMDRQMPEMDGFAATSVIRDQEGDSHTTIVSITTNAMEGDRERCLAASMDDYITKPASLEVLRRAIARWAPDIPIQTEAG